MANLVLGDAGIAARLALRATNAAKVDRQVEQWYVFIADYVR